MPASQFSRLWYCSLVFIGVSLDYCCSCGGTCISLEYTDRVGEVAKKHGLKLHIDGACIFNASVVSNIFPSFLEKKCGLNLCCMAQSKCFCEFYRNISLDTIKCITVWSDFIFVQNMSRICQHELILFLSWILVFLNILPNLLVVCSTAISLVHIENYWFGFFLVSMLLLGVQSHFRVYLLCIFIKENEFRFCFHSLSLL